MESATAAEVVSEREPAEAADLLRSGHPEQAADIVEAMSHDDADDMVGELVGARCRSGPKYSGPVTMKGSWQAIGQRASARRGRRVNGWLTRQSCTADTRGPVANLA